MDENFMELKCKQTFGISQRIVIVDLQLKLCSFFFHACLLSFHLKREYKMSRILYVV